MTVHVYLVEDNPGIRQSLTEALEELAPVRVVGFAEDEKSAVEWLGAHQDACDLVIIDVFLRAGSGIGVLRSLSSFARFRKVVVSNFATDDIRRKCFQLGADRVFDKSNEFDDLVAYCTELDDHGP